MENSKIDFLKDKKIYKYLNDNELMVKEIAKEISDAFLFKMEKDNVEYEYDVLGGNTLCQTSPLLELT